jgi:hypothetical protein
VLSRPRQLLLDILKRIGSKELLAKSLQLVTSRKRRLAKLS